MSMSREEIIRVIKEELPKILLEDSLFKAQIIGILAEALATKGEIGKIIKEIKILREDFIRGTTKLWNEIKNLREETVKLREDFTRETTKLWDELKALREDFNVGMGNFARYLQALGSRWGVFAEDAFREGLRGLLESYFGVKVKKWTYYDEEGYVFGRPSTVDIDVAIVNAKHILIEVKSSVSRGDVGTFIKTASLYKRVLNVEPELVIVSPFVDERALKLAEEAGIRVYTALEELRRRGKSSFTS